MKDNLYCVIMAGGTANRLWPVSRNSRPKQFLPADIFGDSFLRTTYERFLKVVPKENILVVTLGRFADMVRQEIPELSPENLMLEPYGRQTAPCIAYSTYKILKRNPDAIVLTTPSDQEIDDEEAFIEDMKELLGHAAAYPVLMTLGITPRDPETSYGYIQVAGKRSDENRESAVKVKTFVEKPDRTLAEVFCKSGEFFWNSGIFAWRASVIKEELEKYTPEIVSLFEGWEDALDTDKETSFLEKAYSGCQKLSIDYGVMEKTSIAWLYPGHFSWKDLDTWGAVYRYAPEKDKDGNVVIARKSLTQDNKDTMIFSTDKKKVYAVKGLKGFLVVDTEDALLICPCDDKESKDLISGLAMPGFEEFR
ncbi:MAG: mannose-1-phosphate guanylyltransferase [Bacteroidales bacterium]|nr:mannose-1-phosphate guanylyltransferase [Bacteroidales bacterium]